MRIKPILVVQRVFLGHSPWDRFERMKKWSKWPIENRYFVLIHHLHVICGAEQLFAAVLFIESFKLFQLEEQRFCFQDQRKKTFLYCQVTCIRNPLQKGLYFKIIVFSLLKPYSALNIGSVVTFPQCLSDICRSIAT